MGMTNAGEKEVLLELKRRLVYLLRLMGIKNGAQFPIRIHVEIHSLVIGTMEYAVGGVIRGWRSSELNRFRRKAMTLIES